jgi:hypothetical protein
MSHKYGSVHRLSNFIERTIPKKGAATSGLFAFRVIEFLQEIDELRELNGWIDITIHNNDGIWISYQGRRLCFVKPGQINLTLMSGDWSDLANKLVKLADSKGRVFQDTTETKSYRTWRINAEGLSILVNFLKTLKAPTVGPELDSPSHPRNFAPEVRTLALQNFEKGGSICPGVPQLGITKHKLNLKKERIEYDHILPYARGGASSGINIQVLCMECNRAKRDKPL